MALFICYMAGICGTALSFLETFPVPHDAYVLFGGIFAFSLIFGLIFTFRKYMKYFLPLAAGIYAGLLYFYYERVKAGAFVAADVIRVEIRNYFYGENNILIGTQSESMSVTVMLLFLLVIFGAFLFYGTVVRGSRFITIMSTAIPSAGALSIGKVPSLVSVCLLGFCYLGAFAAGGIRSGLGSTVVREWEEEECYIRKVRQKCVLLLSFGAVLIFLASYYIASPVIGDVLGDKAAAREKIQNTDLLTWVREQMPQGKQEGERTITSGQLPDEKHPGFTGETALRLSTGEIPQETIYLKSFTGSRYNGREWEAVNEEVYPDNPYDRAEAIEGYMGINYERELTVRRERAARAAYVPYFSRKLSNGQSDADFFLYFSRSDYESLLLEGSEIGLSPANDRQDYIDYVYSQYLDYPSQSLERLEQVCRENPQGSVGDIKNFIVSYLMENCSYNLNAGGLPKGKEFTEYFMFESHEGFCVHFATAAALMFRMYGVPSRYVTGYIAPSGMFGWQDGNCMAEIPDSMAHAWVEIYLDQAGWVPVEATPYYAGLGNGDSPFESEAPQEGLTENQLESEKNEDGQGQDASEDAGTDSQGANADSKKEQDATKESEAAGSGLLSVLAAAAAVLIAVLAAVTVVFIRRAWILERRRRQDAAGIFRDMFRVLTEGGLPGESDCMAEDFTEKVHEQFKWIPEDEFERVMKITMRANYGKEPVTKEEKLFMRSMYRYICAQVCRSMGRMGKFKFRFWRVYY